MVCDICKKSEATVHLTQIVEGKMLKVDLCETCAKEKGVQEAAGFSLESLLVGLGAPEEIKSDAPGAQCPVCLTSATPSLFLSRDGISDSTSSTTWISLPPPGPRRRLESR